MLCSKCRKDSSVLYNWLCSNCAKIKPVVLTKKQEAKINLVLKDVLKEVKPSVDEQIYIYCLIHSFMHKLSKLLKDKATIVLGGSMAKGTWVR